MHTPCACTFPLTPGIQFGRSLSPVHVPTCMPVPESRDPTLVISLPLDKSWLPWGMEINFCEHRAPAGQLMLSPTHSPLPDPSRDPGEADKAGCGSHCTGGAAEAQRGPGNLPLPALFGMRSPLNPLARLSQHPTPPTPYSRPRLCSTAAAASSEHMGPRCRVKKHAPERRGTRYLAGQLPPQGLQRLLGSQSGTPFLCHTGTQLLHHPEKVSFGELQLLDPAALRQEDA